MIDARCEALANHFQEEVDKGLLDIKLLLQNRLEASHEETCVELMAAENAIKLGRVSDPEFDTLKWKN